MAQGMHVDNFALTYELQDVDMNYKTTTSSSDIAPVNVSSPQGYHTAVRQSDEFTYPLVPGGGGDV